MTLQRRIKEIEERMDFLYELEKERKYWNEPYDELEEEYWDLQEELDCIYRRIDMGIR